MAIIAAAPAPAEHPGIATMSALTLTATFGGTCLDVEGTGHDHKCLRDSSHVLPFVHGFDEHTLNWT